MGRATFQAVAAALDVEPVELFLRHPVSEEGDGLHVAAARGERLVVVLGHPTYYPRFGFSPASALGVTAPMQVPDDSFLALRLGEDGRDPDTGPAGPTGTVRYAAAFGL